MTRIRFLIPLGLVVLALVYATPVYHPKTYHIGFFAEDSVKGIIGVFDTIVAGYWEINDTVVHHADNADSAGIAANSYKLQTLDTAGIHGRDTVGLATQIRPVWQGDISDSCALRLPLHAKADSAAITDTAKAIRPYPLGNAFTNDNMADTLMSLRCDTAKVHIKMRIGTASDTLGIWYNRFNGRYGNTTWLALDSLQFALGTGLSYSSGSAKNYLNIGKNNRLRAYTDYSKAIVGGEACTSENASWATGIIGSRKAHVADKVSFAGGVSSVTLMGENSVAAGAESCYAVNAAGGTTFLMSGGNNQGILVDSGTYNVHVGWYGEGGARYLPSLQQGNNFLWKALIEVPGTKHRRFFNNAVLGHGQGGVGDTVTNVQNSFIGPGYGGTIEGKRGRDIYGLFKGAGTYNTFRGDSSAELDCPAVVTGDYNTVRASYSGVLTGLNNYIDSLANASYLFGTNCTTNTPATAAFYSATGLAARPTSPYNISIGYRRPPLADTGLKVAGRGVFGLPVTAEKIIGVNGGFKADTTVADSEWATIGRAARCTVGLAAAIRPVWGADISDTADVLRGEINDTTQAMLGRTNTWTGTQILNGAPACTAGLNTRAVFDTLKAGKVFASSETLTGSLTAGGGITSVGVLTLKSHAYMPSGYFVRGPGTSRVAIGPQTNGVFLIARNDTIVKLDTLGSLVIRTKQLGGAPACSAGVGTRSAFDSLNAAYANIPTLATTGYLSQRPAMDYSTMIGSGKPTAVSYGCWDGFSLPAYAANEEMHWRDYVPGRWDSISDPTYTVSFALDGLEDVNDTIRLVLLWTSKKFNAGQIANTCKQDTIKVPIVTGRNVAYSVYTATFTLDYDGAFPIAYGSEITGDLRRAEAGLALDIAGEIIILDQRLTYRVDKAFKAAP